MIKEHVNLAQWFLKIVMEIWIRGEETVMIPLFTQERRKAPQFQPVGLYSLTRNL